jgi:ketosteroid isomerase-like protein
LHSRILFSIILLTLVGVGACRTPSPTASLGERPTVPVRTPTPQPASDDEAVRQLIQLEGQGVVAQDIAGLIDLWSEDAVIADAKHTPENATDDARWQGRDAIRERYVVLVFPGNPTSAGAINVEIVVEMDSAIATSTTAIGGEVSPGGDQWTFAKRDGRWWITGLTYNLEPR